MEYVGKCLFIETEGKKILVVGDLHLGFEESLNKSGVLIGRDMYDDMISDFDLIFSKKTVDEVVLLGDVKHEFGKVLKQEWKDVLGLFDYLKKKCKRIILVKGNHDKIIEPIAKKRDVEVVDNYIVGGYCFLHGDKDYDVWGKDVKTVVIGHAHPAISLDDGVKVEKYKCFLVGRYKRKKIVIVPSFFDYYVGSDPRYTKLGLAWDFKFDKFDVMVVGEDLEVLDFGKLGKL